ncbi:hypothetical protein G7Y79_00004g012300 [Physcia stellaris]|nr:hypothetical protein G7Y79_00004g012300 [Physcia stellaris]
MHNHESLKRQGKLSAPNIRDVTIVFFFYPSITILPITIPPINILSITIPPITAPKGFHCYYATWTFAYCSVYHISLRSSYTKTVRGQRTSARGYLLGKFRSTCHRHGPEMNVCWEAQENGPSAHIRYLTKKNNSPPKLSNQPKITAYFDPAANQNRRINQDSRTPNPKRFRQRTSAGMARTKSLPPTKSTPETSAVSPHKVPSITRITSLTKSSKSSAEITSLQTSSQTYSHVCRTCSSIFRSGMGPQHAYDRSISTMGLATAQRTLECAVALLAPEILQPALEKWDLIFLTSCIHYY